MVQVRVRCRVRSGSGSGLVHTTVRSRGSNEHVAGLASEVLEAVSDLRRTSRSGRSCARSRGLEGGCCWCNHSQPLLVSTVMLSGVWTLVGISKVA